MDFPPSVAVPVYSAPFAVALSEPDEDVATHVRVADTEVAVSVPSTRMTFGSRSDQTS